MCSMYKEHKKQSLFGGEGEGGRLNSEAVALTWETRSGARSSPPACVLISSSLKAG